MAGGGGSTGGIGAQSPAVNPPTTGFGQAGNAFAGQLGNIGATALGGAQQPIPQDTASMVGMAPGFGPVQQQMGFMNSLAGGQPLMSQPPMNANMMGGEGFGQQLMTPEKMAMMQYASEQAQQGQAPMGLGQAAQTGALTQQQTAGLGGLAALLGGNPTPPTPTVSPTPTARPAPVASKSTTKTSVVPPRTPPAVASAIQKLAAKKQARMR